MNARVLLRTAFTCILAGCANASSGGLSDGTFTSTVDGIRYVGSPMVYFPRNTAVIQDVGNARLLVIKLMAFEKVHSERATYVWNFSLPAIAGRYTITAANEDACECHMTLESSNFLQYTPGSVQMNVQILDAMHVVASFSGTLRLGEEYKVGHPEAKPQLTMADGDLDIPIGGSGMR